jgi:LysR family glycine cleavage system transcriptional activator
MNMMTIQSRTKTRLPSLRYLRTFQVAGRHLSFKDAADELAVTASAVSHQVRNLEEFLGIRLFDRLTRSLKLTDAGAEYFDFLDTMFARLESETEQLKSEYGRTILRLYVPPFFLSEGLLPRLHASETTSQQIDIRVSKQSSAETAHPPDSDLTILLGDEKRQSLKTQRLFPRSVVVACSSRYLDKHPIKTYDDLNGATLLVHEKNEDSWDNWAKQVGARAPLPGKLIRSDSMSAIARAAQQGLGVGLISWPLGRDWFGEDSLVRVFDEEVPTGNFFFVAMRAEDAERREIQDMCDWVMTEFERFA